MAGRSDYMPKTETVTVGGADKGSRTGPVKAKGKTMTPVFGSNDADMDGDDDAVVRTPPRASSASRTGSALPPNAGNARRGVPAARNLGGDDELGDAPGNRFTPGKGTRARISKMGRLRAVGRMK